MTQGHEENFRADRHADEDLVSFDARDYSGRRAMWMLLLSVILLLVIVFAVFKLYQTGVRDRAAPPRIVADDTPFKVMNDEAGGAETPNTDKTVYDVMNGTVGEEDIVTAPKPEQPVELPRQATIIVDDSKPETPKPVETRPEPRTAPTPAVRAGGSDYVVQVASVRYREDADRLWTEIRQKFSSMLPSGTYADIKRVDLNEKGIYFRLRVAGLPDKNAASQLCKRFEARQQACFVTRR